MVQKLIELSLRNRYIVLLVAAGLLGWGIYAVRQNPIDAIPDLSENQVIVFTEWAGQSPQVIEDQVTYPLVSNLQGIPKIRTVRGTSMFGMSFVYVIFEDNADVYWARTRVLERLNYAQRLLPQGVTPTLGPDGTGVGHVFWYTIDAKDMDLGEQRALQDWYVKLALQTVPGVAEVASFGGFEKQYQLIIDPVKLQYYHVPLVDVLNKVKANNNDVGGRKFEMNDMAYIVRGLGYVKNREDLESIAVGNYNGIPVRVKDVASVQMGGDLRLGIFDENGQGEVVGGIVVMRYGENADRVISDVKKKMGDLQKGLPPGVSFKAAYDRSELTEASINNIKYKLLEEIAVVCIIVILFLFHWRSALSIIIQVPITIAVSFILLNAFGVSSNIMSLTGIALAIGVIVDNGIIMSENAYRQLATPLPPRGGEISPEEII
jgi:CzcA family heavy metal efflux pump